MGADRCVRPLQTCARGITTRTRNSPTCARPNRSETPFFSVCLSFVLLAPPPLRVGVSSPTHRSKRLHLTVGGPPIHTCVDAGSLPSSRPLPSPPSFAPFHRPS